MKDDAKNICVLLLGIAFEMFFAFQISENGRETARYKGTAIPKVYISTSNSVSLSFESDGRTTNTGFLLKYQSKFGVQTKWYFNNAYCGYYIVIYVAC